MVFAGGSTAVLMRSEEGKVSFILDTNVALDSLSDVKIFVNLVEVRCADESVLGHIINPSKHFDRIHLIPCIFRIECAADTTQCSPMMQPSQIDE